MKHSLFLAALGCEILLPQKTFRQIQSNLSSVLQILQMLILKPYYSSATITHYHRLGGKHLFLTALEAGNPSSECEPSVFLVKALFLAQRWSSSWILTRQRNSKLSQVSS